MTPFEVHGAPLDEAARTQRTYGGAILVFRQVAAIERLVARLRDLAQAELGCDPGETHRHYPEPAAQAAAAQALRDAVGRDAPARGLLQEGLHEVGVDLDATFGDVLKLRLQPPAADQDSALVAPLAAHRDTWGSNVMAQANWWAPVLPVTANRTMALFPHLFRAAVANDSASWDLEDFLAARRAGRPYPMLPRATESPAWATAVPLVIAPGDLLCFSGAHLHASVPNTTDLTRLSMEWRTVNGSDARAGRGAPDVDHAAPWVCHHWFTSLKTGTRLQARARR